MYHFNSIWDETHTYWYFALTFCVFAGGGFDPTLLLLLGDNNRNRGHDYPYYPPYNMNNNNNNNMMEKLSFGELALLTLLGLALISRFPTQG